MRLMIGLLLAVAATAADAKDEQRDDWSKHKGPQYQIEAKHRPHHRPHHIKKHHKRHQHHHGHVEYRFQYTHRPYRPHHTTYIETGPSYVYAQVTHVSPIYESVVVNRPVKECRMVEIARQTNHSSPLPTILGAAIGGAIGNHIGSHHPHRGHRGVHTAVGAAIGASIGHSAGQRHHPGHTRYETVERCDWVDHHKTERKITGYNVTYRYRGHKYTTYSHAHPGDRIRVEVDRMRH